MAHVPNNRQVAIRVYLDRILLADLADSDDGLIIDTDGYALGTEPVTVEAIEVTDRVRRGSVSLGDVSAAGTGNTGVDAVVSTLTLELDHGDPNLAPLTDSPANIPADLLTPYRRVRVVGTVDGTSTLLFTGFLGDDIRSTATPGSSSIQVTARDLAKPLQDTFLHEFPILAASAPVGIVTVLNELLALVPASLRPPLYVNGSPAFEVREPYRPQDCTVWDAMQQLVAQTGWHLGVRNGSLTLLDPPRNKITADWQLDEADVFQDDLGISDADVRNVVRVVWTDAATRERRTTEARDQWSIDNITGGIERLSIIALDDTSQIDTEPEAQALADRFIHDMSREFAATQLTLPFLPRLRLFDTLEIEHARFTAEPRLTATVSLRHDFTPTSARTVIVGTGQVIGRRRAWLNGEPRPGSPNDPRGPHAAVLPAPLVTVTDGNPGIVVRVDERRGVDAQGIEIHWSLVNGFTPSDATLKGRGGQEVWTFATTDISAPDHIIPGVTHYVRVRAYDSQNVGGEWTPQMAVIPSKVDPAAIVLDANVEVNGDIDVYGSGGNSGTLRFYQPGPPPELALAVGNVGGLFGAPAGLIGLAGAFGTGIWIDGATQILDAGVSDVTLNFGSPSSGTVVSRTASYNIRASATTIPAHETWFVMVVPVQMAQINSPARYGRLLEYEVGGNGNPGGGGLSRPILGAGVTYDTITADVRMTIEAFGATANISYFVEFLWLLLRRTES